MYYPGGCLAIAASIIWGYQGVRWLIDGYWTSYTLLKLPLQLPSPFEVPTPQWKGAHIFISGVLEFPLGMLVMFAGVLLLFCASLIDDGNERREDRQAKEARKKLGYEDD